MKTILLKMSGPLQSWGTDSHFETRHTDFYPSKSAIIGLIAASLGYRREEDDKIKALNDLSFAVRVDQQGNLLRDYHTARKYKANGEFERTYVTQRYYVEDAIFVVAISHENDTWIEEIEQALKNPYFQPFMGRRALPLCADFILDVNSQEILEALKEYPWQAAVWYQKKIADERVCLTIYADQYLLKEGAYHLRNDKVCSFSQKNRQYAYRYEGTTNTWILNPQAQKQDVVTAHDVWDAL